MEIVESACGKILRVCLMASVIPAVSDGTV
jgi:hypothetical protein